MPDTVMTVTGVDELVRKLERAGKPEVIKAGVKAAAGHIKSIIAKYPPSSEANVPGQRRWYERGWGSKWTRKDGSINGNKSSESLGRKWTVKTPNNYQAIVGNSTSYAPYVHDPDEQAGFHAARGWKTTEQVAEDEIQRVSEFIAKEYEKALAG